MGCWPNTATPSGTASKPTGRSSGSRLKNITAGWGLTFTATATAASTLEALRSLGKRQVILSASRRDYLIEQASQRGLKGYFSELLGLSDIYGVSKIQLGLDFLAESGVDPARCLMIGDTDHDAQVAAALGAKCVLFTGGHQSRPRLESVCDTVIDRLDQLPDLLG